MDSAEMPGHRDGGAAGTPDPDLARVGRLLEQVLELAESLPHDRIPPLPRSPFRHRLPPHIAGEQSPHIVGEQ